MLAPLARRGALALAAMFFATTQDSKFYGPIDDVELAKPEDKQDVESTPPPEGAIVLFDGKSTDEWVKLDGKAPIPWPLRPGGAMEVKGGGIKTKRLFDGHTKLHVEFRVPYMPNQSGQGAGQLGGLLARAIRGPNPRQLRPGQPGQRLRRHLQSRQAEGQRLQGPDRLAELRHRLHGSGLHRGQEGEERPDQRRAERRHHPRGHRDPARQHGLRARRRPEHPRPDPPPGPRQPGPVPEHLDSEARLRLGGDPSRRIRLDRRTKPRGSKRQVAKPRGQHG